MGKHWHYSRHRLTASVSTLTYGSTNSPIGQFVIRQQLNRVSSVTSLYAHLLFPPPTFSQCTHCIELRVDRCRIYGSLSSDNSHRTYFYTNW